MATYKFKINGNDYNVEINSIEGGMADVTVNGASYQVELENSPAASPAMAPAGAVTAGPQAQQAAPACPPAQAPTPAAPSKAGSSVTTPLSGVIIEVSVKVGDAVKSGQKVAVIEAMKMENEIEATTDGTVTAVLVGKGDSVPEGAEIVRIA